MDKSHNIEVAGPEDFTARVFEALTLLREKAPGPYEIIKTSIGLIQQAPAPPTSMSGMAAYETPPTYYMGRKTAFYSLTWCASCIAHDAYHSKLYHDYKKNNPGQAVPDEVWSGPAIELKCNEFQLSVCRCIDAPKHEIDHLESLDGTHSLLAEIDW